tara:strand:- start:198 stop:809 length:612 start_codon:yes stop_codon:yes gene_type:complete
LQGFGWALNQASEDKMMPLMPKATAVWLVENTALTFQQIAGFCEMHPLEVQGIADGEVAVGIIGHDPIASGQLSKDEIARCEADEGAEMELLKAKEGLINLRRKGPRYTPVSKRQERPNAISWLIKYHPELRDAQISRLLGTTKTTITAVRERTHWNIVNIKPQDPVLLGICKQTELEAEVLKASKSTRKILKAAAASAGTTE